MPEADPLRRLLSGAGLVVSRARSSGYVLGMGDSNTRGCGCRRGYETRGSYAAIPRQLAELELCLRCGARSGW
jgi:hypothetical protein